MSLDQDTAVFRAGVIRPGSITYNYHLVFEAEQYSGLAEINFYLENTNFDQLLIDFSGNIKEEVVINNKKFVPNHKDNFLTLPHGSLQKGRNRVSMTYVNTYDNDRTGCISFKDDNLQFIYTHFEPYGCNRVFPCFDQPNLKAKMKLSVVTPKDWAAISNQPALNQEFLNLVTYKKHAKFEHTPSNEMLDKFLANIKATDVKMTLFDYTQLLSTYVYAVSVGPFTWLPADEGKASVPMRMYCVPESALMLGEYSDFIVDVTTKAMAFFQEFFGTPYPFPKYDMIWVRDYANWAMQNAGLVTFNEQKMLQPYSTADDYYNFADTLVHELSHHWFGNFVTMDWWDDLWLNESFADFIAQYALTKINGNLDMKMQSPQMYFRDRKQWGYQDDQRDQGTHAIRGKVANTDVASNIFDGITYAKGAAVIKQLVFMIGENNFSLGLQKYFDQFAFSNATISDFLGVMTQYFPAGVTVNDWRTTWIETPSLNTIEAIWDTSSLSTTSTLRLVQRPFSETYPTMRYHKIQVAFFNANASVVKSQNVELKPDDQETIITYDGSYSVKAILVNYNDHGFVQNILDPTSLQFFINNVDKITDPFLRTTVWYNIAQMSKNSLLKLDLYTELLDSKILDEPTDFIMSQILTQFYGFLANYTTEDDREAQSTVLFDAIYKKLQDLSITGDRLTAYQKFFIKFAHSNDQVVKLKDYLFGDDPLIGSRPIQDETLPWTICKKVFALPDTVYDRDQKEQVFAFNDALDKSTRRDEARVVCDTILCTKQEFNAIYARFKGTQDNLTDRYLLAEGWRSKYHEQWLTDLRDKYFQDMVTVSQTLPYAFFQFFYTQLRPIDSDYSTQISLYNNVIETLAEDPDMAPHVTNLRKIVDDLTLNLVNNAFNADSNNTLSQIRASNRYSYIRAGSITYVSHIAFVSMTTSLDYTGLTEMTFELTKVPNLLPIDFKTKQILNLQVNGINVTPWLVGEYLIIPKVYLVEGVNNIGVHYRNQLDNDGLGCLMYIDNTVSPSQEYTYTTFEPHSAHRFIPCFDQPDLKAYLYLHVILPTTWIAVSNEQDSYNGNYTLAAYKSRCQNPNSELLAIYLNNKAGKFYIFNRTVQLPTYLYSLVAGQYVKITATAAQLYKNIPMSVYSLASYQTALTNNANMIFEITAKAIQFFEGKFGIPYQFSKYDTAFCHQYSAGAMENPGIVTFTDNYLYQQEVSVEKKVQLGVVICHECAHHWFGDYVTMKWWDDLWLNESFADYMAYYCMDNIKTSVESFTYTSGWYNALIRAVDGFRADQDDTTTHPIRPSVPNTNLAKVYFDSITYRKGFMTLRQLVYIMGEAKFLNGLKAYFAQFGWGNATTDDFLAALKPFFTPGVADYTMDLWKESWLLTPSINVFEGSWNPNNVTSSSIFTVKQTNYSPNIGTLRYHKLNVCFIRENGTFTNPAPQAKLVPNTNDDALFVFDNSNTTNPIRAIIINYQFQDFCKVTIDADSLAWLKTNISRITGNVANSGLLRMTIWFYINQMVRDGKMTVAEYRDMVLNNISNETQDTIYDFQLKFVSTATGSYLPITDRAAAREPVFDFVLSELEDLNSVPQKPKVNKNIMKNKWFSTFKMLQPEKQQKAVGDDANRIKVLADLLPVFPTTEAHIQLLDQWRQGIYDPLVNIPIQMSQAFNVVKLIYTSPGYTSDRRLEIFDQVKDFFPQSGNLAALTKNTVDGLDNLTDDVAFETVYEIFLDSEQSLTVKASYAAGWNTGVHSRWLKQTYKPRIFKDMPGLSKTLSFDHFAFFYTNLAPLDDDLDQNITYYQGVSLPGEDMLGHRTNIQKIINNYKLKQKLYAAQ